MEGRMGRSHCLMACKITPVTPHYYKKGYQNGHPLLIKSLGGTGTYVRVYISMQYMPSDTSITQMNLLDQKME